MSRPQLSALERFLSIEIDSLQWPTLLSGELLGNEGAHVVLTLRVPAELQYFTGHFPEQPVLPGVVQIHWAGEFSKRLFGVSGFSSLQGAKFNGMVLPETTIRLELLFKMEKNSVRFNYTNGDEKISVGSLKFDGGAQ